MYALSHPAEAAERRVLLVDDVQANCMIVSAFLSARGHICDEASSASDALALLERYDYGVLILDLDLGNGVDAGLDLLRTLRRDPRWEHLRTIILTSHPTAQEEAFDIGASDYVTKPFDPRILGARVARAFRERQEVIAAKGGEREAARELAEAGTVQRACLPAVPAVHSGIAVSGAVASRVDVGGDVFDVVPDPKGRVAVVVVDVAGHGAAAAMVGASARIAARGALERGLELREVLRAVHDCLRGYVGILEANAAIGIARFDEALRQVEVVNLGLPPIVFSHRGESTAIASSGPPLGFARQPEWAPLLAPLSPGDLVTIFTDGATGQSFTPDASIELARRAGAETFGAALAMAGGASLERFLAEVTKDDPTDDATIVVAGALLSC